jgi:hypothetical protein
MTSRILKRRNTRNRSALDPAVPRKGAPATIASIAATAADTIQITFNTNVFKNKTPGYTAGAGGAETVELATQISATVVQLVFTGAVAGTDLVVQEGDPGIRTAAGGFVPAGSYPVPTFP